MRYSSFYGNLSGFKKANDRTMTNDIMLHELSHAIVYRRDDIIDKMNESGITTDSSINAQELADKVFENLNNKKFVDGISLVIAKKNHDDFENFTSVNAKDSKNVKNGEKKLNVISDVSDELKKIDATSKNDLKERVAIFDMESNTKPEPRGGGLKILGILGVSALSIYGIIHWHNKIG